jgi:hypothetical protein
MAGEPRGVTERALAQAGVITRKQALAGGLTASAIEHRLRRGSWVRAHPGVFRTFTGAPDAEARAWAALLYAGAGATLGPRETFASLGLRTWPQTLTVIVPAERRVRAQPRVEILRSRQLDRWRATGAWLPRMRAESAALLLVHQSSDDTAAIDAVVTVTSNRRTTADRLRDELERWPRVARRRLLLEMLEDVEDGVASPLERRWRRDVERAHGLPTAARNARSQHAGRTLYRDLDYDPFPAVAELDGRLYHPDEERFRDRERDNLAARQQKYALRYGWREVVNDPCGCARELADVLRACGWAGELRRCMSGCTAARAA